MTRGKFVGSVRCVSGTAVAVAFVVVVVVVDAVVLDCNNGTFV